MAAEPYDGLYQIPYQHTVKTNGYAVRDGTRWESTGYVQTYHGSVEVYSVWHPDNSQFTRLDFIYDGLMHYRNIDAYYQPRYLVTLARRFAAEIATGA